MATFAHDLLDRLHTPLWVISVDNQEIVFANRAAKALSGDHQLIEMRYGCFSANAQESLKAYIPALSANEQVVEIWTIEKDGASLPLTCRLSLFATDQMPQAILFEGVVTDWLVPRNTDRGNIGNRRRSDQGNNERQFYEQLFRTNTAPMLLIDPAAEGRIIDANHAATEFYGYSRPALCRKHTWEINVMGRDVIPVMNEIAKLPGGHKPLNFVHRLADGSLRDVQTYAGQIELDGKRLMLCIIHDITEQKRLRRELEVAASVDPLTGVWNRRQCLILLDNSRVHKRRYDIDYSILLIDVDKFKAINDQYGHDIGDEILVLLARTIDARIRESDSICRWGGEEFIVLLPQTVLKNALDLAECLRQSIAAIEHPRINRVSVSIGVAEHRGEETTEALVKRADEALYRAKAAGRNQVVAADDSVLSIG